MHIKNEKKVYICEFRIQIIKFINIITSFNRCTIIHHWIDNELMMDFNVDLHRIKLSH